MVLPLFNQYLKDGPPAKLAVATIYNTLSALDEIANSISALATQLSGFIAENRATLRPASEVSR